MLALSKSGHKLYEVTRAKDIAALVKKQNITIKQVVSETEALEAKDAELAENAAIIARLRANLLKTPGGGGEVRPASGIVKVKGGGGGGGGCSLQ